MGHPVGLLSAAAETLLKKKKSSEGTEGQRKAKNKVVVIPYVHEISHNLKIEGHSIGVDGVFSSLEEFSGMCKKANSDPKGKQNYEKA